MASPAAQSLDLLFGTSRTAAFDYHTSRVLCRTINAQLSDIDCKVSTPERDLDSSEQVYVITNVRTGALDLGLIDSAVQYDAANNAGRFEYLDIGFDNLRSLFSVKAVPFAVIARQRKIESFDDLKGKKINIGNPGSTHRTIMDHLTQVADWSEQDLQLAEELPTAQSALALCFGTVDAVVRFESHPNAATRHMTELCDARIVEMPGSTVDKLVSASPFYVPMTIPGGVYKSNSSDVPTVGLTQTVVASEDLDEETAYKIVKLVFEELERLKSLLSAPGLSQDSMREQGLSMPLHPGALRYFREKGWVN